jgi:hypothetical protein
MWWYHGYPPHDEIRLRGDVHSPHPGTSHSQTVRPGKASGFDVWWSNWCGPPARVVFQVLLPGGARSTAWSRGPRCDAPGYPSTVTISPYGGGFGL